MNARHLFRFVITLATALTLAIPSSSTALAQELSNDDFAQATVISSTHFNDSLDISSASIEIGEPFCYTSSEHTVWYVYQAPSHGIAEITLYPGFDAFLAVYTGPDWDNLININCAGYFSGTVTYELQDQETYYIQIGGIYESAGSMNFEMDFNPWPPNDNFANAQEIYLDIPVTLDNTLTTTEEGEPISDCAHWGLFHSVWFSYSPTSDGFVTAEAHGSRNVVAAYTGNALDNLTLLSCCNDWNKLPIQVLAGTTYYFQVSSYNWWDYGEFTFRLFETPAVTAGFWYSPEDPNVIDNIYFCDSTYDPMFAQIIDHSWDFGDGTFSSGDCVNHQYTADGDYTAMLNIQTIDGRTDDEVKTVLVRTHDVLITRVSAPLSASVGQTRTISVDIKNTRYSENVRLILYKSVVNSRDAFQEVGYMTQYVPVRSGNRTSRFNFTYTFAPEDAAAGKVSFKVVAELQGSRDAYPTDNEAVSTPPTKVSGKIPSSSTEVRSPQ